MGAERGYRRDRPSASAQRRSVRTIHVARHRRLDAAALSLIPLRLEDRGTWSPNDEYWGEEGAPIDKWAKPIIARGPRREFEMEQVLPGADSGDPFSDPISESNDRKDSGDTKGAYKLLMDLC